jgi:mannose-6-phosphate isomerase-like protein (cupin superfamily)
MGDYTVKRVDEMERAFGGMWVRARASLGATAFGLEIMDLAPGFPAGLYPKHTNEHGHEEVYIVLDGEGEMTLETETVKLAPETLIRVGPAVARDIFPGPNGLRMLVISGTPGGAYNAPARTELGGPEEELGGSVA